jgi:adenylate cyclase
MNGGRFHELLLASIGVGVAVLDPRTLDVVFHNARLAEWLGIEEGRPMTLPELVPGIDPERLRDRMARGRAYTGEATGRAGRREIAVALQVTPYEREDGTLLFAEFQNVSKIKELEYAIESYSAMVEKQNRTLQREKERAEQLLLNIMPRKVFEEIRAFGVTAPQRFDEASILMLDFVGFTELSGSRDPAWLVAELNDIFSAFDRIVEQFGCERVKTMGDAYMAVSGVPEPTPDHAQNIAKTALLFRRYIEKRNASRDETWLCRIGIHTGPVVGSIVGIQKYVYDIFGPAVNMASRLEGLADPMEILLSGEMRDRIESDFRLEDRGPVDVRGVGLTPVYALVGEDRVARADPATTLGRGNGDGASP